MELAWHRFETHRSPKGHGMRARAGSKTLEAWQDASGRWRVRSTDRPQDKPDLRSWSEARAWAEKRASSNPVPEQNPQVVHSGVTDRDTRRERKNDMSARKNPSRRWVRVPGAWLRKGMIVKAPLWVQQFDEDDDYKKRPKTVPWKKFWAPDPAPKILRVDYWGDYHVDPLDDDGESDLQALNDDGTDAYGSVDLNTADYPDTWMVDVDSIDMDDETRAETLAGGFYPPDPKENPMSAAPKPRGKTSNPAQGKRGEVDTTAGDELELYIDNDQPLYRQWETITANIAKHKARGNYSHERAVDGYMYLVDAGAKKYAKEWDSASNWNTMFDSATRRYVAGEYAKSFEQNLREESRFAPVKKSKKNPLASFDELSAHEQVEAIHAYARGLEIGSGAAAMTYTTTPKYNAFVAIGESDAKTALTSSRAGNPTPPQSAWVVVERGRATGLFFAPEALERTSASKIPTGPAGRRRNGAGLGAFLGSLAGSVVGTALAAAGAMSLASTGGLVVAPLSLLISAAGGAIGGHVGASSKSKRRGAIGGGVGGLFGPLGAALGGYLGGRKADKRKNPRERAIARRLTA
jgi:hypothetical protein